MAFWSSVVSTIFGGIIKFFTGWLDKMNKTELETEAKAKAEALKSVNVARALEERMRTIADPDDPPTSPKLKQRWHDPKTNTTKEWNGKEWENAKENDTDLFGDAAWND